MYREEHTHYHQYPRRRTSLLGSIVRFIFVGFLIVLALTGGLALIVPIIGLTIGLITLFISIAPVIFGIWLVWIVLRAIFA